MVRRIPDFGNRGSCCIDPSAAGRGLPGEAVGANGRSFFHLSEEVLGHKAAEACLSHASWKPQVASGLYEAALRVGGHISQDTPVAP